MLYLKKLFTLLSILLLLLFLPTNSYAKGEQIKIAIIPFNNLSGKQDYNWIGSGFSETMISALTNVGNIQITERFLMTEVLKEVALQQSGFIDEKSTVKIGKLTGANIIISGSYQILNDELVINARFINVEKGTVEEGSAFYLRGKLATLFDLQEKLATSFNEKFKITMSKQEETNVKKAIFSTKSLEANKLYIEAKERYSNGGYNGKKEAISLLKRALEIDSNYALAWAFLGEVSIDLSKTQYFLHDLLKIENDYKSLQDDGFEDFKKALLLFPDSYEIYRSIGSGFLKAENKIEAEKYLKKALELKPDDVGSLLLMGKIKNNLIENLNKALTIDPYNYEIYYNFGRYYLSQSKNNPENIQLALNNFTKAVELNPYSWEINMQLVQTYMKLKNYDGAVAWAERMVKMEKDPISYIIATSAYMRAKNLPKMREMYLEIDKSLDSPFIKAFIAGTYLNDKEYQKAFSFTTTALNKYPNDPELNQVMAMIYFEYYHNCKFSFYHYELFLKNIEKMNYFNLEAKKKALEKYEMIKKACETK